MNECVQCFLDSVSAGKASCRTTMAWYAKRLGRFMRWVESNGYEPFSRRAFNAFIAYLKFQEYSMETVRGYVIILRRLGRWLVEEGHCERNPSTDLKYPPKSKHSPKGISEDDFRKLLGAAEKLRDKTLLLVLWGSGGRAEEIMTLHWRDVDMSNGHVRVVGKGNKERLIFFLDEALESLRCYRETVPHEPDDSLWWSLTKECPLTYWGLYQLLKRLGKKVDVKRFNPHSFRHGFGRRLTKNGCPTLAVQSLMGHASPETTRIYTYLDEDDLAEIQHRYDS
ncbi:MAG: tyrosine-type recombinase/integrase [Anaerolineae bacterium]|nr:tyrosine-type recombinase/integrase [Anaerolineae bacterium]